MKKFQDTLLGFWWLILRPLLPAAVAVAIFTFVVRMESHGLPYAIFYLAGFMTWSVFQSTVTFMARTLLWMQGMMRRVYFPKLLIPLASIGLPLLELAVLLAVFALTVLFFWIRDGQSFLIGDWRLLLFPACLVMALLFGMAIGMFVSVVALFVRDVVFTVAYFAQLLMFLTPVLYPVSFVPEHYRWALYLLNPMATLVEVSRWSLTGLGDFNPVFLAAACATILLLVGLSVAFFMRAERILADHI